jgi:hypothetical protein
MDMGIQKFSTGLTTALTSIITGTQKAGEAFKQFGQALLGAIVEFFVEWAVQSVLAMTLGKMMTALSIKQASALANAWSAAAFFKSVVDPSAPAVAVGALAAGLGVSAGLAGALSAISGGAGGGESVAFGGGSANLPMGFMAGGGVLNEPTMMVGMRSGRRNMAGEAGPEAIVPLNERSQEFASASNRAVNIIINGPVLSDDPILWDKITREHILPAMDRDNRRQVA